MTKEERKELYRAAENARENAYCPYSGISVGAALITADGSIYTGVNIENSAHSPGVCAERSAIFAAIGAGERSFKAIAVAGGRRGDAPLEKFPPCGVCRQVLSEFCDGNFKVIFGEDACEDLSQLLPYSFGKEYTK